MSCYVITRITGTNFTCLRVQRENEIPHYAPNSFLQFALEEMLEEKILED